MWRLGVELTPGADACAECGSRLRRLGENVTEELEYVPGRFIVNRIVRPRFTCACCERFVQAPLPSRPIERGRSGPGLLAHVLVRSQIVASAAVRFPESSSDQCLQRDVESGRHCAVPKVPVSTVERNTTTAVIGLRACSALINCASLRVNSL